MILSIGEILVDIFKDGNKEEIHPGGAPFNVASNISTFGGDISFYGVVGNDKYGQYLKDAATKKIKKVYIDIKDGRDTTVALVELKDGERSFKFIRDNASDYLFDIAHLNRFNFDNVNIIHLGSLMLSHPIGEAFFYEAIKYIKDNTHALISFDVNYRDDIFKDKEILIKALNKADIIKFSQDELKLLSNKENVLDGLKTLINDNQIALVTLGKEGSIFYNKDKYIKVPSIPTKPIDSTGAGDAFYSYFLFQLDNGLDINDDNQIKATLKRANIVGALSTKKKGASDFIPSLEEIEYIYFQN